jgi:hypothetical protein
MIHDPGPALDAETNENAASRPATSAGRRCRQRISTNDRIPSTGSPTSHHQTIGSGARSAADRSGIPHTVRLIRAASP